MPGTTALPADDYTVSMMTSLSVCHMTLFHVTSLTVGGYECSTEEAFTGGITPELCIT